MKKLYVLMLLLTVSSIFFGPAIKANDFSSTDRKRVRLQGDLLVISIRSVSDPVQAFLDGQTLEIYFLANVGTVVVSVEGNNKTLYQQDIDTTNDKQVFIDLSAFENGEYTLKIANDKGESLIGEFLK